MDITKVVFRKMLRCPGQTRNTCDNSTVPIHVSSPPRLTELLPGGQHQAGAGLQGAGQTAALGGLRGAGQTVGSRGERPLEAEHLKVGSECCRCPGGTQCPHELSQDSGADDKSRARVSTQGSLVSVHGRSPGRRRSGCSRGRRKISLESPHCPVCPASPQEHCGSAVPSGPGAKTLEHCLCGVLQALSPPQRSSHTVSCRDGAHSSHPQAPGRGQARRRHATGVC